MQNLLSGYTTVMFCKQPLSVFVVAGVLSVVTCSCVGCVFSEGEVVGNTAGVVSCVGQSVKKKKKN